MTSAVIRIFTRLTITKVFTTVHTRSNGMDAPFLNWHRGAKVEVQNRATLLRGSVTVKITTIGIDLAKAVFQVHGVDGRGKVLVRSSSSVRMSWGSLRILNRA